MRTHRIHAHKKYPQTNQSQLTVLSLAGHERIGQTIAAGGPPDGVVVQHGLEQVLGLGGDGLPEGTAKNQNINASY